jgi:hypothetical protein
MKYLTKIDLPFRFLVFTNKPDLFKEFEEKLYGKLSVSDYVPRNKLLRILGGMDFLLNFDNNTTRNSPSKLIDYAIVNRPVLNIKQSLNEDDLVAFLKGDYRNQMQLPNIEKYHIGNVAKLFLGLIIN